MVYNPPTFIEEFREFREFEETYYQEAKSFIKKGDYHGARNLLNEAKYSKSNFGSNTLSCINDLIGRLDKEDFDPIKYTRFIERTLQQTKNILRFKVNINNHIESIIRSLL